jgi:uncharacterized protein YndB with AHSA1/START domain
MIKTKSNSVQQIAEQALVITRVFDAPRSLVFKAWTDPERVRQWWGPKGFTCPFCKIDLRPGGVYLNCMRSPEGRDYWSTGVYREIVSSKRIVCTDSFADEDGNLVTAAHYGMSADYPLEMMITVTLKEIEGKTRLTLIHDGIPPGKEQDNCRAGWNESLDKLADYLARAIPEKQEL